MKRILSIFIIITMIISSMPVLAEDDWENIFGDFENFDIADAEEGEVIDVAPVSYTHLDVYKRQMQNGRKKIWLYIR